MKIHHLRCFPNGTPFGTIVINASGNVGVAICHPNEEFDRSLGATIAHGRARLNPYNEGLTKLPNRKFVVSAWVQNGKIQTTTISLEAIVKTAIHRMSITNEQPVG